ncbi:hypothetical protein TCAL_01249 [Tigriopus californicus]|uniref:Nuclear cap-binding protein subunit 3 n=1 Tax=Tigriopus californicus TaxID=6832 RepID=A0A553NXX0_TIGCA|nr:nuclear cap-binding protein subunit 3-like [Tigriopus californicus]TRY70281.1 hypothetical protein TCAL_01249 [Tigriopus californicus]|eukprot:TCALIF_01249-PA protein Name:"Similar to zgc:55870 Uncharacterized protein C17orf85 homolog (Danio rerio)" AED:0.00 eAED:0.00 QI:138/1/1/1/0.75/0.8/5/96/820
MEMEEGELSDEGGPLETPPSPPPPMASHRRSSAQWASHSNPPGIQVTFQTGARDLPDLVRSIDGGDQLPLDRSLTERMEKRAKRFNLSGWKSQVNFDLIQGLYQSLGIPEDERDGKLDKDQRMFRLEALHVHGVGKMVAEDIYDYFKEFNPISYEWVDSKSVNVGWALSSTSAQALLALSRPILEAEDEAMEVNERVVDENGDQEPRAKPEPLTKEELLDKFERSKDEPFTRDEIPGPIPAGCWRLGKPSQQVTTIFMRIATVKDSASGHPTEDKQLFQKNRQLRMEGGLLSASRKRKLHEVVQFDRERVAEEERAKKYTGPVGKNPWGSIAKDWTQTPKSRDFADELQLFAQQRGIGIPGPGPLRPLVKDWDQPQDLNEEFYEEEIEEDDAIWKKKLKRPRMSMVADAIEVKRPPARNRLHVHRRISNPSRIEIYEQEEEDDDYEDEPLVPARDLRMTIKTKVDPDAPESNQRLTERFHGSVHRRLGEKRRNSDDSLERDNGEDLRGELTDRHLRGKNMLIQVSRSDGEEDREVERINQKVPSLVSVKQEKMEDEADRSVKTIRRIQSPVEPLESKKEVREQIRRQERQKTENSQLDRSRSSRVSDRGVAKKKPLNDREMIRKPMKDTDRKDSRSISSRRPGIKIKKEKTSDDEKKKRKTKKRDDSSSSSDDESTSGDSSSDSSSSDTSSSGSSDSSDSDSDSSSSSSSSDSEDEKAKRRKKKISSSSGIGSKKKLSSYSDRSKLQKRGISRREDIREGRKTTSSVSVFKRDTQDHNSKGRGSKKVDDKKKSSKDDSGLREKLKKYLKNAKEKRSTSKK